MRSGVAAPAAITDVRTLLDEMRLIKDGHELATMRARRADFDGRAPARDAGDAPGRAEFEIEAELLHEFRRGGAQAPAYTSIVAGGANACVLHYVQNDARAEGRRPAADRCRLRARWLRVRHHAHVSR